MPKLIQTDYIGDGCYTYQCSYCQNSLSFSGLSLSDYTILDEKEIKTGVYIPHAFPIKFCWNCGLKFDKIKKIS